MNRENLTTLLEKLNVLSAKTGAGFWIPRSGRGGANVLIACPFAAEPGSPHRNTVERNPSMSISIREADRSPWYCWTCQHRGGEVAALVTQLGEAYGISSHETDPLRFWAQDHELPDLDTLLARLGAPQEPPSIHITEEMLGEMTQSVPQFILDRGYTLDTCRAWGLGYDYEQDRLVIPVRDAAGRLLGILERACWDDQQPKYLIDEGFRKSDHLFGLQRCRFNCPVLLVEGPLDVIWLHQIGYSESDVISTMGTSVSETQRLALVRGWSEVWVLYDNDDPGRQGARKAAERLQSLLPVSIVPYPPGTPDGRDPNDFSKDAIMAMVAQRSDASLGALAAPL